MSDSAPTLDNLLSLVKTRERAARRRVVIFSVVPVLLAGMLLLYTGQRIRDANSALASIDARLEQEVRKVREAETRSSELNDQLERTQSDLRKSQEQVETLRKQLQDAAGYRRDLAPGNPAMLMKYVASRYHQQGRVFIDIFELQNRGVGFTPGGFSERGGFDSPSFAAYLLGKSNLLPGNVAAADVRYRLRETLPSEDSPKVGDLVFYSLGYTMFFCRDDHDHPFVVGMTPYGILPLRVDFAQVTGYAHVPYLN